MGDHAVEVASGDAEAGVGDDHVTAFVDVPAAERGGDERPHVVLLALQLEVREVRGERRVAQHAHIELLDGGRDGAGPADLVVDGGHDRANAAKPRTGRRGSWLPGRPTVSRTPIYRGTSRARRPRTPPSRRRGARRGARAGARPRARLPAARPGR